jgi:DNA-binding NarL/FixJ family response regulator
MRTRTRVIVIDDSEVFLLGLRYFFDDITDIELVGQAQNAAQAPKLIENLKPDVVLMDVRMPNAIEAVGFIRRQDPNVKIIMLTSTDNEHEIFAALATGANGYCLKETNFDRLLASLRTVTTGGIWLDSAIAAKVVKALPQSIPLLGAQIDQEQEQEKGQDSEALSQREIEVLTLVSTGLSNQRIAQRLSISSETVKTHIRHIMKKLAVSDRTQAAVVALRQGLI